MRLLRPQADSGEELCKWPKECKPTPTQVMRDLAILRAAAHLLHEPVYLFGDDAKDYFSQLAMAPECWWLLGIVFLTPSQLEERRQAFRCNLHSLSVLIGYREITDQSTIFPWIFSRETGTWYM